MTDKIVNEPSENPPDRNDQQAFRRWIWAKVSKPFLDYSEIIKSRYPYRYRLTPEEIDGIAATTLVWFFENFDPALGTPVAAFFVQKFQWNLKNAIRDLKRGRRCQKCEEGIDRVTGDKCLHCQNGRVLATESFIDISEHPTLIATDSDGPTGVLPLTPGYLGAEWLESLDEDHRNIIQQVIQELKPRELVIWWLFMQGFSGGRNGIEEWMLRDCDEEIQDEILSLEPNNIYTISRRVQKKVERIVKHYREENHS